MVFGIAHWSIGDMQEGDIVKYTSVKCVTLQSGQLVQHCIAKTHAS